jgi:hypothetical protein
MKTLIAKIISLFDKEKWVLVKTLDVQHISSKHKINGTSENGKFYTHLFESSKGNRKVTFGCTIMDLTPNHMDEFGKSTEVYNERVLRWLSGRYDPAIPSYNEIPEEETANALKGEI